MSGKREWWIEFDGDPRGDKECYKRYVSGEIMSTPFPNHEVVHVIEASAVKELEVSRDEWKKMALYERDLAAERFQTWKEAEAKLAIAVEVLEFYAGFGHRTEVGRLMFERYENLEQKEIGTLAREILEKIK